MIRNKKRLGFLWGVFYIGEGSQKRTFRFISWNASFYFFGTFRFADYTHFNFLNQSDKFTKSLHPQAKTSHIELQ